MTLLSFDRFFEALAQRGHFVAAPDLRGHGDSEWSPTVNYTLATQLGDVYAVIERMPAAPALIGASMGGQIALCATERRYTEAALNVHVPTLLLRGTRSEIVTSESVRHFQKLMPHAEFLDVADAAHMIAGDRNDAFSAAVLEFLDGILWD